MNNHFIKHILIQHERQNQNDLEQINQQIRNAIHESYRDNILFKLNEQNYQDTLHKLLNEYYLYQDTIVIGDYIRYIEKDNKMYPNLKLKMGGFVMKDNLKQFVVKNKLGRIFTIQKEKYNIFIKLSKNDKFRFALQNI